MKFPRWMRVSHVANYGHYHSFTFDAFITVEGQYVEEKNGQANTEFENAMVETPIEELQQYLPNKEPIYEIY